jgi:hypothetical protein
MNATMKTAFALLFLGEFGVASQWAGAQIAPPTAVRTVTTPKQFFGFDIGDDYSLANYQQLKG